MSDAWAYLSIPAKRIRKGVKKASKALTQRTEAKQTDNQRKNRGLHETETGSTPKTHQNTSKETKEPAPCLSRKKGGYLPRAIWSKA